MQQSETLTPEEAAAILRVNPQTVYRALRAGKLPGAKVGAQWRILRADLEEYLRTGGRQAASGEAEAPPRIGKGYGIIDPPAPYGDGRQGEG